MSLGAAIAELQRRFDWLARTKGGNPGTYGTKGGKGQQPKRKNNPAHVAGAIAVLKALSTSRRWPRPSPPVAEQGGWGLRGGPIYLSLQKTSASASRLSIYLSKYRAPLKFGLYLREKNAILGLV